jgi:hypothetical protein
MDIPSSPITPRGRVSRWFRATARVVLGLFVVGQLLFLLLANAAGLEAGLRGYARRVPVFAQAAPEWVEEKGNTYAAIQAIRNATERWAEATGQPQQWQLFAPDVTDYVPFPAVELRWDEELLPIKPTAKMLVPLAAGNPLEASVLAAARQLPAAAPPLPLLLRSDNEPRERGRFFKVGHFRLRRYEGTLDVLGSLGDKPFDPISVRWHDWIAEGVRDKAGSMRAYLRYCLTAFREERPDLPPPTQVILVMRLYHIPEPPGPHPWDWEYLGQHYVARWLLGIEHEPGYSPLEAYNPLVNRFDRFRK